MHSVAPNRPAHPTAIVVGAGPAGLMAAEMLALAGIRVDVFDAMATPARKFLRAGIGGLNLTHSEPLDRFVTRYGAQARRFARWLAEFGPEQQRAWAKDLGIDTFVGSSGRVFPTDFKAAPMLRAWLRRLDGLGARLHSRHRWLGWAPDGALRFATPTGETTARADAVVLALGGASWPQLGADGGWVELLAAQGVAIQPLKPANCGFDVAWSPHFRDRFAGQPVKSVGLSFDGRSLKGEFVVTATGIEGGAVYALSAALRDHCPGAVLMLDLKPDWDTAKLQAALAKPRGSRSLSHHLDRTIGLKGVAAGLLRELARPLPETPAALAACIKALPLPLLRPRPLAEAISTAGGVAFGGVDDGLMLTGLPGVFVAGEMLDWEAPTGGYLLTGCFATGRLAGLSATAWVRRQAPAPATPT
ncbi:MAG TPA: TIGR03862 family flavoprotein [Magnetospirillum sp.]|nr:TIGR03862 family flavoprotein [Magnetospirillum sp.]